MTTEFSCICGKCFKTKRSLGVHKQHCEKYLEVIGKSQTEYICPDCQRSFKSSASLQAHLTHCKIHEAKSRKMLHSSTYWCKDEDMYICECGKSFEKSQSLLAHFSMCLVHKAAIGVEVKISPTKIRTDSRCNFSKNGCSAEEFERLHRNQGQSLHNNIISGKTTPNWLGRHHTPDSKKKLRLAAVKYLQSMTKGGGPRYNKSSIPVLEKIALERGWHIQHAENGGEFHTGIGYFLDAYDAEKNIALEYDEPKHYVDAEHNILCQKDIDRQHEIIEHLHCEFWRFNSVTQSLWKVEI